MANQMRFDPTRTTTLRRKFMNEMKRRFNIIKRLNVELIVTDDVFGLSEKTTMLTLAAGFREKQAWRFMTDTQKLKSYQTWLQQQIDAQILSTDATGKPWMGTYVESAYKKGMIRAYTDAHKADLISQPSIFQGGQAEFLRQAFGQPETLSKIELVSTRAFTELKGVTDYMSQQLSRIIAGGLAHGRSPAQMAREIADSIGAITRQRANVIARTETIYAHAEGQLDSFERLNISGVGVKAEWQTAGDDRVCEMCYTLEGVVLTIKEAHGLLPRHPNCRCMWLPAAVGEKDDGRTVWDIYDDKWTRSRGQLTGKNADKALAKSIDKERKSGSYVSKRRRSPWLGKARIPANTRP